MASKSRFGYFSIYPNNRAGITEYAQKKGTYFYIFSKLKKINLAKFKQILEEFTQVVDLLKY